MNLFVCNLAYRMTDVQLRALFETCGKVDSAQIIHDKNTHQSKGFGFVKMPNEIEANEAINRLNGAEEMGRTLTVRVAEEKPQRTNRR